MTATPKRAAATVPARIAASLARRSPARRRFARSLLGLAPAAVALARPSPVGASAATGPAFDRPFGDSIGLVVKFHQGQPQTDLPTLLDLGVRWVRDGVSWPDIETRPGHYEPMPPAFAERLAFYRRHDIGLVYTLAYDNDVAYPPNAAAPHAAIDPHAYGRHAVEVARRLRAAGIRFALAVWNEPHNFVLRPMLGGAWNGRPPSPWVDHYVAMVDAVVQRVKAFDATVPVMTDDDMWVLHYWFLDKGLPPALDGFAFHPYTTLEPEKTAVAADTEWTAPHQVVDADRSFRSAVRRLREQGERHLGRTPRLWITEWGYAAGPPSDPDRFDPQTVAAYLPRAYVTAFAAGIETTFWFSAFDAVDGPMGLIDLDGRRRPAYRALATLTRQLGAYRFVRQWGDGRAMQPRQAYLFRHGDRYRVVLWRFADADAPSTARLDIPGLDLLSLRIGAGVAARAVDLFGRPIAEPAPDGPDEQRLDVPLGGAPVYLSIEPPAAHAVAVLRRIERQCFDGRCAAC
ncbi:MAG: hypothetical protein QM674_19595 [Burkholderiaceae bacterium]